MPVKKHCVGIVVVRGLEVANIPFRLRQTAEGLGQSGTVGVLCRFAHPIEEESARFRESPLAPCLITFCKKFLEFVCHLKNIIAFRLYSEAALLKNG